MWLIANDRHRVSCDQSALEHLFHSWEQRCDALGGVDPLQHQRQVRREIDERGGVDPAVCAVACYSAIDCRTGRAFARRNSSSALQSGLP